MVGNSSSGLTEAPALGVPSVNVGRRQEGRYACSSVISCGGSREEIVKAIKRAVSPEFRAFARAADNPFDLGGASGIIHREIKSALAAGISPVKEFYDIDF